MEVSIRKVRESRKGIPPSRTYTCGEGEEIEHKHTPPPHSKICAKLFSLSTGILHTIPTSGSRQAKHVLSKPVVTAVFKTFALSGMQRECEKGVKEPKGLSFLPQIILQVRSKCSTSPRRQKIEDIAEKDSGKETKNSGGNLRRFESKFHNASLRSSFKVFPEAHPRGIMINVLKKENVWTPTVGHACMGLVSPPRFAFYLQSLWRFWS